MREKFGLRCLLPLDLSCVSQRLTEGAGSKLSSDGPCAEIRINPSSVGVFKEAQRLLLILFCAETILSQLSVDNDLQRVPLVYNILNLTSC